MPSSWLLARPLPVWPARACALLALLLAAVLLLAPRSYWPRALQRDLAAVRASSGVPLGLAVQQATLSSLRILPTACSAPARLVCLSQATLGWCDGWCLPVHLLVHTALLALWIGLVAPLLWCVGAGGGSVTTGALADTGQPQPVGWRAALAWLPPVTLVWACLPGGFGLAPVWAVLWTLGALHLRGAAVVWPDD